MRYLALGDSISIDDYTEVPGGGAASQFSRLIDASEYDNRTKDGRTTQGVLEALAIPFGTPEVVTLTVCGNDLLMGLVSCGADWQQMANDVIARYDLIAGRLRELRCPVIINTIYDPTDGRDELATQMEMPGSVREPFDLVNNHIRSCEGGNLILSDLEALFAGHGYWSDDPWLVGFVEPNYPGATAIATHWFHLFRSSST